MSLGTIVVVLFVSAMVALAIRSIRKDRQAGKMCGSCSGCGQHTKCHEKK